MGTSSAQVLLLVAMQASSGGEWLCLMLVLAGVNAWVDEEGEDDGFEYTEDGWRIHPEDMYRDHGNDYSDTEIKDDEALLGLDALQRMPRTMGEIASDDFLGVERRQYNVTKDGGVSGGGGGMFRSSGGLKSRGHFTHINKDPDPLPHQPHPEDPKGCGNPLCVVLDRKVYRFPSLCTYSSHICNENRKDQMNFIQKGDCYDISENSIPHTRLSQLAAY